MIQSAHYYTLLKGMTTISFNRVPNRSRQLENKRLMSILPMRCSSDT